MAGRNLQAVKAVPVGRSHKRRNDFLPWVAGAVPENAGKQAAAIKIFTKYIKHLTQFYQYIKIIY